MKAICDKDEFDRDFKALAEKAINRYDTAHNMIGFFNAQYSNKQTEGLKVGSLITHSENRHPGIFQNSQVLITRFRRTGLQGLSQCEGIIINKPSEIAENNLSSRRS